MQSCPWGYMLGTVTPLPDENAAGERPAWTFLQLLRLMTRDSRLVGYSIAAVVPALALARWSPWIGLAAGAFVSVPFIAVLIRQAELRHEETQRGGA